MGAVVEVEGVHKRFGDVAAVRGVDLRLEAGRVYGLLGPNGSGKTTMMRMILAILPPDRGVLRVFGGRPTDGKRRIGYLPEDRGLAADQRVDAFVAYLARLKGTPTAGLERRIADWLGRVGLAHKARESCGGLSRGEAQRVQAVIAMIHAPDLLILDEPFNGLDPESRDVLAGVFAEEHARGCTLVLSTHLLAHAEQVCDHVVMMDRGEKVLDAPLAAVLSRAGSRELLCEPLEPSAPDPLRALPGVEQVTALRDGFRLSLRADAVAAEVLAAAARALPLARAEIVRPTLDDVFLRTVRARRAA